MAENSEILFVARFSVFEYLCFFNGLHWLVHDLKLAQMKNEVSFRKHENIIISDKHAYFVTDIHPILLL